MKSKTKSSIILLAGLLLITSCSESVKTGPTSTPDPLLMTLSERAIWEFDNFRNEVNGLAAAAATTPTEDLEPIIKQMMALKEEIQGCDFPLSASQAHSALLNFALFTEQCYFGKYAGYLAEISGHESMIGSDDRCNQALIYEETLDLYLQELKEMNTED